MVLALSGMLIFALYPRSAASATYTWDNGGATSNWSDCDNWTSDTCPGPSDIARFDGTSVADSIVDATFTGSVDGVDINSGYTGTITQERNLTISDQNYNQADGTWKQLTFTFDINDGDFIQSDGIFETGVGTNNIGHSLLISGGTFTSSSTRVFNFDGGNNDPTTFTYPGTFPATVDITKSGTSNARFTVTSGTIIPSWSGAIDAVGGLTVSEGSAVHFGSTAVSIDTSFTISGTTTASSTFNLDNASFVLNATGYFDFDGSLITIEDSYTDNGGTFDETGITFRFDGANNAPTAFTYSGSFPGIVDISKTGSTNSVFTIITGTTISNWDSSIASADPIVIQNGAAAHFGNTALDDVGGLTISGTTTASSTIDIDDGDFILNSTGYFDYAGTTFQIESDYIDNGGIFDATGVTITFNGGNNRPGSFTKSGVFTGAIIITKTGGSNSEFSLSSGADVTLGGNSSLVDDLRINGTLRTNGFNLTTSRTMPLSTGATLAVQGDETISTPTIGENATIEYTGSGTYSSLLLGTNYENLSFSGGGTYNIANSITVEDDLISTNDSTFNQTSGTFTLDGTDDQTVTGTSTFSNLEASATSPRTITFGAGETTTITGFTTLTGASFDNYLAIASNLPGTQFKIDPQGGRIVSALRVMDSNNTNVSTITCDDNCLNGGNNTNWDIPRLREKYRLQGGIRMNGGVRF